MVYVGDVVTAINGVPMLGCGTSMVAIAVQALPACGTLRLVKHGVDFVVPAVARIQVCCVPAVSSVGDSSGRLTPSLVLVYGVPSARRL